MAQWQRRLLLLLVALVAAGGFVGMRYLSAEDEAARAFWLSTDPSVNVLELRYAGGMTGTFTDHRVFADGRFMVQVVDAQNNQVVRQHEMQLSDDELQTLVAVGVDGGLIEYDHERIETMLRGSFVHDAGTMTVTMQLERYRGPGQRVWGPASCSITIRGVSTRARSYPEIEEFQALVALGREINRYRKLAEAQGAN